jgi:hypothetical protein
VARRVPKEMTVDEFDAWSSARSKVKSIAEAADEVGGPRLSLVPLPEQDIAWPTDLLPANPPPARLGRSGLQGSDDPEGSAECPRREGDHSRADANGGGGDPASCSIAATPFDGIPLESSRKRLAGWSAERQKLFLTVLAETGQVHLAAAGARLSARSAQALRVRSPAFNAGWRMAEQLGAGRLAPIAFDRAINGRIEQVYRDGELIAERRVPSDKLLMWLLARLDPKRFALPWEQRGDADPQADAVNAFSGILDSLSDTPS